MTPRPLTLLMRAKPMATESLPPREAAESAAAAWIARRDTAEWDAAAFDAWLKESVSHRVAYYRLHAAWLEAGRLRALSRGSPSAATPTNESTTDPAGNIGLAPEPAYQSPRTRFALAASIAAILIAAVAVWKVEQPAPGRFATVVGGLEAVPLADGSRVTLNTDSELQVAFEPQERVVNLDRGEAYFEVAKDPSRPFIVNVGKKRVIAVGTQFSVRRDGDEVSVVVTEGTVRLEPRERRHGLQGDRGPTLSASKSSSGPSLSSPGGSADSVLSDSPGSSEVVFVPAGSVARAQADAVLVENVPPGEIEQHLSWRSGQLIFRDTRLRDAAAEFNRYNERKIVIEDPRIANLQLGGVFRSTNIDPFIELLDQGFPVRATVEGDRIVLTHN
jgi:transmembrane sensor